MVQYTAAQFDPFTAAAATPISTVRVRDRVAVAGTVTELTVQYWVGGTQALHVTVTDDTGSLVVAFLGRRRVAGVEAGRAVTVAGAVIHYRGRALIMNPYLWLTGEATLSDEPASDRALVSA
jgi:RecJ-like exonuclease